MNLRMALAIGLGAAIFAGATRADTFTLSCGEGAQTLAVDTRGYVREMRGEAVGPRHQAMVSQDEIRFTVDRPWEARTHFRIDRRTGLERVARFDYAAGRETVSSRPCRKLVGPEGYAF